MTGKGNQFADSKLLLPQWPPYIWLCALLYLVSNGLAPSCQRLYEVPIHTVTQQQVPLF